VKSRSVRRWLAFLVSLLLAGAGASVFAAEAKPPVISKILVDGLHNVTEFTVLNTLSVKEGDPLSLRRVRNDIRALYELGHFEDVSMDVEDTKVAGEVVLRVQVVERLRVSSVVFEGNKKKKDKKLREEMKTKPKESFDPARLNEDVGKIEKKYREDGYFLVKVTADTQMNEQDRTVQVVVRVDEGDQLKIGKITVAGVESYSEKKVRNRMKEIREGKKYKGDLLQEDLHKIEAFYRDEGYLKALILDHEVRIDEAQKLVFITIRLREGLQYRMGDAGFEGHKVYEATDLQKVLRLKTGEILKQKDLDAAAGAVRAVYADKGYIYSSVNPDLKYDDELRKVDITFKIVEGEVAYIQDIKITGNYKTRDYVIRRELSMKAGEKFEAAKIRSSTMNLYNLGFFEEVNPEVEPGEERGKEVLVFRVKERKTGSISVGGGYSSVDHWVGNVKFEEANLFGRGQRFNIEWEFGKRRNSYQVGFTEPWLFGTRTSFGIDLFNVIRDLDFYTEKRLGGNLRLGRRLTRMWSVFGTYLYERVTIRDVAATYSNPDLPNFIPESTSATSSFTPRIVYDSRDNYFEPTRGWKHQLSVEIAGGPFGANQNFIKTTHDSSKFIPLFWKFVLGNHVRLGYARGYKARGRYTDVPVYERFFCGGTDTVRGYPERSIGPSVGGRVLYVWNTELKYPIAGPLKGVLFFDAGDAWEDVHRIENTLEYGYGVGVRLTIPGTVMAIRLDYGWPLDTKNDEAEKNGELHFNLGDIF
jgi:outer membrane protein insertion porin family